MAIQSAQLNAEGHRRVAQMEAIQAIARQAAVTLDLDELLEKLCQVVLRSFPVDHVTVVLNSEGTLTVREHRGNLTPRFASSLELPEGASLCRRALESGATVVPGRP